MSVGDFAPGATIDLAFTTRFGGVPTTLAGTPAVSVYKDASLTQSTSGVTLITDFDSVTGLNHVAIDTSANGTFYAAGSSFQVVITAGTVGGASVVGVVVDQFTLQATSALSAAAIRSAVGLASANLDSQLAALPTATTDLATLIGRLSDARATLLDNLANLDAAISAIVLSSSERNAIADAYLDRTNGIEAGLTPRQADRLIVAAILAKASGMDANAPVFRDFNDTKDRLTAATDEFGNRLSVTYDPS